MFFPCQSLEAVLSQNNCESIRYTDSSHTYKDPFTIYFQLSTIYFLEFVEVKHNNLIISPQIQQEQTVETLLRYRPRHCNSILSLESTKNGSFSTPDQEVIVTILETTHKFKSKGIISGCHHHKIAQSSIEASSLLV